MIYSMLSIVWIYIFLYIRICLQLSTSVYRVRGLPSKWAVSVSQYRKVQTGDIYVLTGRYTIPNTPKTEGYFSWRVVQRIFGKALSTN